MGVTLTIVGVSIGVSGFLGIGYWLSTRLDRHNLRILQKIFFPRSRSRNNPSEHLDIPAIFNRPYPGPLLTEEQPRLVSTDYYYHPRLDQNNFRPGLRGNERNPYRLPSPTIWERHFERIASRSRAARISASESQNPEDFMDIYFPVYNHNDEEYGLDTSSSLPPYHQRLYRSLENLAHRMFNRPVSREDFRSLVAMTQRGRGGAGRPVEEEDVEKLNEKLKEQADFFGAVETPELIVPKSEDNGGVRPDYLDVSTELKNPSQVD